MARMLSGRVRRGVVSAIAIITALVAFVPIATKSSTAMAAASWWQPTPAAPIHWQWQIGTPFNMATDLIPNVTVYNIDIFDTSATTVADLHGRGFIVIGYASFGTYEDWRPDEASFPTSVRGSSNGWPGEKWLDIRSDAVKTVMAARLDLAKSKGFDAIEPDNIDGYSNSTGFPLTAQDQLTYNRWIADQCHLRGLSAGLKNDVDQASALAPYFDWTLNEEAYQYDEYSTLTAFTSLNKAVFQVEYGTSTPQASAMNGLHFNSMTRDLNLVSPGSSGYKRLPCIPDTQNAWTSTTPVNAAPVLAAIGNKTVVQNSQLQFTISATDPNSGDTLTYSASGLPTGATFTPATRVFSWTPTVAGTYSNVAFQVSDGSLNDSEAISITVTAAQPANAAPVLAAIGNKTVVQNSQLQFTISATDSNSGDTLTYSASGLPTGASFSTSTRVFSWTPTTVGTYSNITFQVSDGALNDSETISITVTAPVPVNAAPVLAAIGNKTVVQNSQLQFTISATDSNSGDTLTYSASSLPGGASFTPATRVFSWTPTTVGTYSNVTFQVTDGALNDSEAISITVTAPVPVNAAPVLAAIGNKTVVQNSQLQFTISATDPNSGDTLTYSASSLPTGASFTPATRIFSWTPTVAGTYSNITFQVTDGALPDTETISITVTAVVPPPVIPTPTPAPAPVVSSGGGLGGWAGTPPAAGQTGITQYLLSDGSFAMDASLSNTDSTVSLTILKGTSLLTTGGVPSNYVTMAKVAASDLPPAPEEYRLGGPVFDLGPDGATINPPALLALSYDPTNIPPGDLVVGYWNAETRAWMVLDGSTVNPNTAMVTAPIHHFSVYAILVRPSPPLLQLTASATTNAVVESVNQVPEGSPAAITPIASTPPAPVTVRPYLASSGVVDFPGIPWAAWAQAGSISVATISAGWSALLAWRRRLQQAISFNDQEAV